MQLNLDICQQILYLCFFYFSSAVVIAFSMILWPPEMYHSEDIRQKLCMKTVWHSFQCIFIMILRSKRWEKHSSERINFRCCLLRYIDMDKPSFLASAFYFSMFFHVATMYGYNGFFCHHDHDDDDHVRRVCD